MNRSSAFAAWVLAGLGLAVAAGCRRAEEKPEPALNARPGSLEFCIVANEDDDAGAIEAARRYFAGLADDPKERAELDRLAKEGKPPPPPRPDKGEVFVAVGLDASYRWAEIGPHELRTLGLDDEGEDTPFGKELRSAVATARDRGELYVLRNPGVGRMGCALWSRECQNESLPEAERRKKGFDYFMLLRDPEPGKAITAHHVEYVGATRGDSGAPAVAGRLNPEGAARMRELTTLNRPDNVGGERLVRQLAILVNGKVVTAPSVETPIGDAFEITGAFTAGEAQDLVRAIRGE